MAIAFGSWLNSADKPSSGNVSSYTTGSFTPTADSLIIVAVLWSKASIGNTPTCSGGSLSWSSIQDQLNFDTVASPSHALGWFWAIAPASPSSMTVTIDFASENQTGCAIHVWDLTGEVVDFLGRMIL